jgi:hypothetical protein
VCFDGVDFISPPASGFSSLAGSVGWAWPRGAGHPGCAQRAPTASSLPPWGARHDSGIEGSLWGGITYWLATWLATRLFVAWACASVGPVAAPERPSATRPQDAILPHKRPSALAYKYAQMPAVLRLNHAGLHFHVAHPPPCCETDFSRLRCMIPARLEAGENTCELSGLFKFDGGLKGMGGLWAQARLPASPGISSALRYRQILFRTRQSDSRGIGLAEARAENS